MTNKTKAILLKEAATIIFEEVSYIKKGLSMTNEDAIALENALEIINEVKAELNNN